MTQQFFRRREAKYLLSEPEYQAILELMAKKMQPDQHPTSRIFNTYFDTAGDELVIASLESPDYKYKVRARSYGRDSVGKVFFEIKSKYDGVVYKRRAILSEDEYQTYLTTGQYRENQVMNEVDFLFKTKGLLPKLFIAYDRVSFASKDDSDLRITFDTNLRSQKDDTSLKEHEACQDYFTENRYIMEIKSASGLYQCG